MVRRPSGKISSVTTVDAVVCCLSQESLFQYIFRFKEHYVGIYYAIITKINASVSYSWAGRLIPTHQQA